MVWFLNGVCRHEQNKINGKLVYIFLNGVCRHELEKELYALGCKFLNGVCRHEHYLPYLCLLFIVSKWRMSP